MWQLWVNSQIVLCVYLLITTFSAFTVVSLSRQAISFDYFMLGVAGSTLKGYACLCSTPPLNNVKNAGKDQYLNMLALDVTWLSHKQCRHVARGSWNVNTSPTQLNSCIETLNKGVELVAKVFDLNRHTTLITKLLCFLTGIRETVLISANFAQNQVVWILTSTNFYIARVT